MNELIVFVVVLYAILGLFVVQFVRKKQEPRHTSHEEDIVKRFLVVLFWPIYLVGHVMFAY